jgi:hypothetical protein
MPIYPIKCGCGFAGDVFARVMEMDSAGRILCPECGERAEQQYAQKRVSSGNREFRGDRQESITEGWHPDDVPRVQREMVANGDTEAANCIRPTDGAVLFKNRQQQQAYMRAKARIWQRVSEGPGESMSDVLAKTAAKARARTKARAKRR